MNFQLRPWLSLLQHPHSPSDFPETQKEALSTPLARAPHRLADQGTQESTVLDGGPALCCLLGQRPSSYSVRTIPQGLCPPARPPRTVCPGRTRQETSSEVDPSPLGLLANRGRAEGRCSRNRGLYREQVQPRIQQSPQF